MRPRILDRVPASKQPERAGEAGKEEYPMKLVAAVLLVALLLVPGVALAGSEDAALALGAFAVFNQIISGTGIFGGAAPVVVAPQPVVVAPQPVYAPPPVYVAPAPVVVAPRPVYVAPRPVYVAPRPVYVAPRPIVVTPRPVVVYRGPGHGYHRVDYDRGHGHGHGQKWGHRGRDRD
jgi:hypothetical protein